MHGDVDDASLVVEHRQNTSPSLAAIFGLEQSAFAARSIKSSECTDIDDVGIGRMDYDVADLIGSLEPHILPRFAAVGRFVDAVAKRYGVTRIRFARPDPHNVFVRR